MKQKDIAMIILIAVFGGVMSYFVANKIFVSKSIKEQKYPVVNELKTDFNLPDQRFFNQESINPTRDAGLDATNQTPFNGVQ